MKNHLFCLLGKKNSIGKLGGKSEMLSPFRWWMAIRKRWRSIQLARGTLNRYLLILKRLIFESSVRAGRPSLVAAPDCPEIRP